MLSSFPQRLGCLVAVALLFSFSAPLSAIETNAREAILMDFDTGAVLFEKDADFSMPPASMSKIMTVFMVFEALRDGRVTMESLLPVSEKAWRMGGSKMFVDVGTEVSVSDLLRGVIVQSGNAASPGTSSPFTPSSMTSRIPGESAPTTAFPLAIASSRAFGLPS